VDANEPTLDELAGAILDGTCVDWRTVQSIANETERPLVEELHVLATLADLHRQQRAESARPPQTWGHIRILEPLGTGAFGHVYRAWDTRLDREVALKLLPARSDAEDARTSSIIEEGRLLARVRHLNVVTIYGAERIGDTVGLWMELIDGVTVEQRLAHDGPFQPSEVVEIGTQICHAVSAVHGAGLLHRDIKAQNVMIATDGRAVLMDFGTGWEMSEASGSTGALAGTPLYLAPELLRGGESTIQSDVYSIGVLLYRMLTGTYPVRARNFGIYVLPTNVAIETTSSRFDAMRRDGWPTSSRGRWIPMRNAATRASTRLAPRLRRSSRALRSFRSNMRSRWRQHSCLAVCCCQKERCACATTLRLPTQDHRRLPRWQGAPMGLRLQCSR
jgi:serine/threonine protein kinase